VASFSAAGRRSHQPTPRQSARELAGADHLDGPPSPISQHA
jgi:hypothetical protein